MQGSEYAGDLPLSLNLLWSSVIGGLSRGRRDGAAAVGEEEAGSGDEVEQQHTDCYLIRIIFIGRISEWIDLDSEDEKLRLNTELKLKQEIAWASIT